LTTDRAERRFAFELTGEQMRIIREENGLTQREVAEWLEVDASYVAHMEKGSRRINRRTAVAFCAFINAHKSMKGR
jgi:transcriptional regulator with XRE-family HTH domain